MGSIDFAHAADAKERAEHVRPQTPARQATGLEQYGDVAGTVLDGSFYADPNGLSDLTVAACAPIGLGLSWPPSGRPRPITSDRRAAARACVRVGRYGARPGA